MKNGISSLWKNEDWWAVWLGFAIIIVALLGIVPKVPKVGKWTNDPIVAFMVVRDGVADGTILLPLLILMVCLGALTAVGVGFMKVERIGRYLAGFAGVFVLACLS